MKFSSNIKETLELLHEDIDLLQQQAEDTLPTPMKIEAVKMPWGRRSIESEFKTQRAYGGNNLATTPEAITTHLNLATTRIDAEVVEITKLHETNLAAITNNKLIHQKVHTFMKKIGVRETYSEYAYKTSRSRNTTESKHIAGYMDDLSRVVPTKDGYGLVARSAADYKKKLKDYASKLNQKAITEQREKAATDKAKKKLKVFATLCVKYDLEADAEDYDIREAILAKDKYLNLAYWLERNRGDWNDGYSYAETGLDSFSVETKEDQLIHNDIRSYMDDWDGDGRVFRDCEYNYGVIYGMVADSVLLKDLRTLQEYMDEC